jgi:hypothetical protein
VRRPCQYKKKRQPFTFSRVFLRRSRRSTFPVHPALANPAVAPPKQRDEREKKRMGEKKSGEGENKTQKVLAKKKAPPDQNKNAELSLSSLSTSDLAKIKKHQSPESSVC